MKAVAILNCDKRQADEAAAALSEAGVDAGVETVGGDAIRERAEAAVNQGAELLIVGGGDGSEGSGNTRS